MKNIVASFIITPEQSEQLRKLSYTSRKTKSALVREAIDWLIKNAPKGEVDK